MQERSLRRLRLFCRRGAVFEHIISRIMRLENNIIGEMIKPIAEANSHENVVLNAKLILVDVKAAPGDLHI